MNWQSLLPDVERNKGKTNKKYGLWSDSRGYRKEIYKKRSYKYYK